MADVDTDAELVTRILGGDRAAYEALIERHLERVRAVARAVLGADASAVDDAVQEALIKAYHRLGQLSDARTFAGWLAAIVRNEALTGLRRTSGRRNVPLAAVEHSAAMAGGLAAGTEAEADEAQRARLAALGRALGKLKPEYREILALKYEAKLSYEAIAATLDTSTINVEKRLYRARQALMHLLGDDAR